MTAPLFSRQTLPLILGLLLIAVVPQLSIFRVGPLPSFFLESAALVGCLVFVLFTVLWGNATQKPSAASVYFVILAAFWAIQARAMNLSYVALSDVVAWTFVILAMCSWACRAWVLKLGQERALSVLAMVLLMGALAQAVVGWLQYTGAAANFSGYLMYRSGVVEGQLAQRNHFAHYLMWGVLSAAWLWTQRRLPTIVAFGAAMFLAATMALTGSRTIFGYVLAMCVLLPFYRVVAGKISQRAMWTFGVATLLVLVAQFALEPILNLFRDASIQSAAERLGNSAFEGSGRGYEWRKAWQIFQAAPVWGHGWGSYAYDGFVENVYPTGFRPYENNVLFTHSHNSFLNLLAEMGMVGTALVLGGLFFVMKSCLKRIHAPVGLFLLALTSVSLVHSVLEYPLWYIYLLAPFALFIGFAPPTSSSSHPKFAYSRALSLGVAALSLLILGGMLRLGVAYQQLRQVSGKSDVSVVQRADNIVGLIRIAKTEPILRYYAQLQLMNYIDPNAKQLPDWALTHARQNALYRPYANAHKYAFAAYRAGRVDEARQFMQLMYHYYPAKMPAYAASIMNTSYYVGLRDDYTAACRAYFASLKQSPQCAEPLILPLQ